jgi:hypothetical protein
MPSSSRAVSAAPGEPHTAISPAPTSVALVAADGNEVGRGVGPAPGVLPPLRPHAPAKTLAATTKVRHERDNLGLILGSGE